MDSSAGFPPISQSDAHTLILGSLPGKISLQKKAYYAHPRNAFWRIVGDLFGIRGSYEVRCRALAQQGIAVWDVLQESVRPGSLDASIVTETAIANDFAGFLVAHPQIQKIGFNGKAAEMLFVQKVVSTLATPCPPMTSLPSTSPAYAAMPYDEKLALWRNFLLPQSYGDKGVLE